MNIFKTKHNYNLYIRLLELSRNIFFYKNINLKDSFETRIYLMFFHFSILMLVYKKRGEKFDQINYDNFFHSIENDLRELGFGDVYVNKKMKDLNKILYDILLKLEKSEESTKLIMLNTKLIKKYFNELNGQNDLNLKKLEKYFLFFFNFCFEIPIKTMLKEIKNFKY